MKYSAQSNTVIKHEIEDGPERLISCVHVHTHTCTHILHLYVGMYKMETLPRVL